MTQAELIQALKDRGYGQVNARVLTSWRAKGLLPPLTKRGKGQGRGTDEAWDEAEILERAIAIYEFMLEHRRAETALLKLWFAGFDVDPKLVRSAWLRKFETSSNWIRRKSESRLDSEALFSNMAIAFAKRANLPVVIDRHVAIDASFEMFCAYWDDTYQWELEGAFEPIAVMLTALSRSKDPTLDVSDIISEANIHAFFLCMKNVFSHTAKRRLIESATDIEHTKTHEFWTRIIRLVSSLYRSAGGDLKNLKVSERCRPAIAFGGVMAHLLLLTHRMGLSEQIEKSLQIIEFIVERIATANGSFKPGENLLDVASDAELDSHRRRWLSIWGSVDFREIANDLLHDKTLTLEG